MAAFYSWYLPPFLKFFTIYENEVIDLLQRPGWTANHAEDVVYQQLEESRLICGGNDFQP
jgi:hypothetical protein